MNEPMWIPQATAEMILRTHVAAVAADGAKACVVCTRLGCGSNGAPVAWPCDSVRNANEVLRRMRRQAEVQMSPRGSNRTREIEGCRN